MNSNRRKVNNFRSNVHKSEKCGIIGADYFNRRGKTIIAIFNFNEIMIDEANDKCK